MDTVLAISLVLVQNSFTVVYLVRGLTYIIVVDQCLGTRSSITGQERKRALYLAHVVHIYSNLLRK